MQKFHIKWEVIHWKKLWRELWFRTANVRLLDQKVTPWVYRVNVFIDGQKFAWAGTYLSWSEVFEVHIFDFNSDIYHKEIEVYICYKIRENIKFTTLEALKNTISNDVIKLKNEKISSMAFWTFDVVHDWHKYYLSESLKYADELIVVVARDVSVEHFKWKETMHNQETRLKDVQNLWITNNIILGHSTDYYKCIRDYKPKIICLWYDQKSANVWLEKYLSENNLDINVIILEPFSPEKYKSSIIKKSQK